MFNTAYVRIRIDGYNLTFTMSLRTEGLASIGAPLDKKLNYSKGRRSSRIPTRKTLE